jgi:hypothetical protein
MVCFRYISVNTLHKGDDDDDDDDDDDNHHLVNITVVVFTVVLPISFRMEIRCTG